MRGGVEGGWCGVGGGVEGFRYMAPPYFIPDCSKTLKQCYVRIPRYRTRSRYNLRMFLHVYV